MTLPLGNTTFYPPMSDSSCNDCGQKRDRGYTKKFKKKKTGFWVNLFATCPSNTVSHKGNVEPARARIIMILRSGYISELNGKADFLSHRGNPPVPCLRL